MSFVEQILLPDEQLCARGVIHWAMFLPTFLTSILFTATWYMILERIFGARLPGILIPFFIVPWMPFIAKLMKFLGTESAVTSRRVLHKQGVISRYASEITLSKIETVGMSQGVFGRLFDFGTVYVHGTGGKGIAIEGIAEPLEFRGMIQEVLDWHEKERANERVH